MPTVLLHPDVEQRLSRLPNDIEERIRDKLADAGDSPDHYLKPLKGRDEYVLRVGERRCIIDWRMTDGELRVLKVDTRDTVYD